MQNKCNMKCQHNLSDFGKTHNLKDLSVNCFWKHISDNRHYILDIYDRCIDSITVVNKFLHCTETVNQLVNAFGLISKQICSSQVDGTLMKRMSTKEVDLIWRKMYSNKNVKEQILQSLTEFLQICSLCDTDSDTVHNDNRRSDSVTRGVVEKQQNLSVLKTINISENLGKERGLHYLDDSLSQTAIENRSSKLICKHNMVVSRLLLILCNKVSGDQHKNCRHISLVCSNTLFVETVIFQFHHSDSKHIVTSDLDMLEQYKPAWDLCLQRKVPFLIGMKNCTSVNIDLYVKGRCVQCCLKLIIHLIPSGYVTEIVLETWTIIPKPYIYFTYRPKDKAELTITGCSSPIKDITSNMLKRNYSYKYEVISKKNISLPCSTYFKKGWTMISKADHKSYEMLKFRILTRKHAIDVDHPLLILKNSIVENAGRDSFILSSFAKYDYNDVKQIMDYISVNQCELTRLWFNNNPIADLKASLDTERNGEQGRCENLYLHFGKCKGLPSANDEPIYIKDGVATEDTSMKSNIYADGKEMIVQDGIVITSEEQLFISNNNDMFYNKMESQRKYMLNGLQSMEYGNCFNFDKNPQMKWSKTLKHDLFDQVFRATDVVIVAPVYRKDLEHSFQRLLQGVPELSSEIMRFEHHRLSTFHKFDFKDSPSLIIMARAGWFATGKGKETETFCCLVLYSKWTARDNPFDIHRDLTPTCPFLKGSDVGQVSVQQTTDNNPRIVSDNADTNTVSNIEGEIIRGIQNTYIQNTGVTSNQRNHGRGNDDGVLRNTDEYSRENGQNKQPATATPPDVFDARSCSMDHPSRSIVNGHHDKRFPSPLYRQVNEVRNGRNGVNTNTAMSRHHENVSNLNEQFNPHHQRAENKDELTNGHAYLPQRQTPQLPPPLTSASKHPEYSLYGTRMSSYSGFPSYTGQSIRTLSMAGFYFRGFADRTVCFSCGLGIQNWQRDDDPYIEHAKFSVRCNYLRQLKGDDFVKLVLFATQTGESSYSSYSATGRETSEDTFIISEIREMGFSSESINAALSHLQSINERPTKQKVVNLILENNEALETINTEMFNSSSENSDNVGEISSTGATNNDSSDVQSQSLSDLPHENDDVGASNAAGSKQASSFLSTEEIKEQFICKVCMDERVGIVFTPCGHIVSCQKCSKKLRKCPICREYISEKITTFIV